MEAPDVTSEEPKVFFQEAEEQLQLLDPPRARGGQ